MTTSMIDFYCAIAGNKELANASFRLNIWVSIKIVKSEESARSRELRAFEELKDCRGIVRLLDHFVHHGCNGAHQCLVFELLGPTVNLTVADSFEDGDCLETEYILKMSTQLLETVQLMHNLGYVHGGMSSLRLTHDVMLTASQILLLGISHFMLLALLH